MTDKATPSPASANIYERLISVPKDAVLKIDTPNPLGVDTRSIPVGAMCHEAADALRAEVERLAAQAAPTEPGGDVEPVATYHGRCTIDCGEHGHLDMQLLKMIPAGSQLYSASTVAALKARVAELEKDAARLEFVCNSPNRMVERESGLWRVYEDVAPTDHPTAVWQGMTPRWHVTPREAIDAAITAALTKGQP